MRRHGSRAMAPRRSRPVTPDNKHALPIAGNLRARTFVATRPKQIRLAEINTIPTDEGWPPLAVVLDLFSRRGVGWAIRDHLRHELAIAALTMVIQRQRPTNVPGRGLIHHSDRGSQYCCRRQPRVAGHERNQSVNAPEGQLLGANGAAPPVRVAL